MTVHAFVDETEHKGFVMIAAVLDPQAKAILGLPVELEVYDASAIRDMRAARTECLRQPAEGLISRAAHRLVLEQDESLVVADRGDLFSNLQAVPADRRFAYDHVPARSEPLLWIADAAAWCWTHGSVWQSRVEERIGAVYRL